MKIYNTLEEKYIFDSSNEAEFIHKVRQIAIENDDEDLSIICLSEAKEYIEVYCDNLILK